MSVLRCLYTTTSGRCSCRAFSRFLSTFCRYYASVPHSSSTFRLMASGRGDSDAPACSRKRGLGHCLLSHLTPSCSAAHPPKS